MDNNTNKRKENKSMYLYTALIFVVALLLIILAFFGQTNISKLGNRANELAQATEVASSTPTTAPTTEEFARISNMASALDKENMDLKNKLSVCDNLINANDLASKGNYFEAKEIMELIDETTLTDSQKVLCKQIKDKIAEGEEQ